MSLVIFQKLFKISFVFYSVRLSRGISFRQQQVFCYSPLFNAVLRLFKIYMSVQIYMVMISQFG